MKAKQSGITLIGFLVVLMVVGFFGFMAMKLIPAYSEYLGVVKAMKGIASDGTSGKTLDQIRHDLSYKLSMQYVDDKTVTPSDISIIHGDGRISQLRIAYDKDIPFLYNIDFLLHFDKSVPLQGNVGE